MRQNEPTLSHKTNKTRPQNQIIIRKQNQAQDQILSQRHKFFQWKTSFYQFSNMASSGLRKMLTLINFKTLWCMGVCVSCNFMDTVVNGNHYALANVITIVLYRQMLCQSTFIRVPMSLKLFIFQNKTVIPIHII